MYYEHEIQYWQQFSIKSRFWFEMLCNNKSEKFNFEGDGNPECSTALSISKASR